MKRSSDALAAWASILGALVTLVGFFESARPLAAIGVCLLLLSGLALLQAKRDREKLRSASVNLEGLHLDALNVANLRRRLNQTLIVRRAYHRAIIRSGDLSVSWQYEGYCRVPSTSSIEFSIDSDKNIPFDDLDCYAYDLHQDPERRHAIRPLLIGDDGLSKKVAVPFLKPLTVQEPFSTLLECKIPGCFASGVQYYTSTLSFEQESVTECAVHLSFIGTRPEWLRVYDIDAQGKPLLIRELQPHKGTTEWTEYIDVIEDAPGQLMRIYTFCYGPSPSELQLIDQTLWHAWSASHALPVTSETVERRK